MGKRIRNRKHARRHPFSGLLPRGRRERREVKLLGSAAVGLTALLVISIFLASSLDRYLLGASQYGAVVSAVLVDLANSDRSSQDVPALTINPLLVEAAQAKADDMAKYSYFAHVSPQGVDPWHWFQVVGYSFNYAGENLAVDFSDSGDVNTAWMNSPTHRENILDPHFTQIGIATSQGMYEGHPTTFVVQEFGTPSGTTGTASAIRSQTIPSSPTQPALATTQSAPANVLGTSVENAASAPAVQPIAAAATQKVSETLAVVPTSASAAAPDYAPWWAHLIASPRSLLGYAYWFLALLVWLALCFATGLELRLHHTRKALAAGVLLSFIVVMLVVANTFVFTHPTLTPQASMTAAAGSAF